MPAGIHGTGRQASANDEAGGTVGRDTSRDQSGDQAAWRDLVARLELPSAIDPGNAPWPDRENLTPAAAEAPTTQPLPADQDRPADRARRQAAQERDAADPARQQAAADRAEEQDAARAGETQPGKDAPGKDAPGNDAPGKDAPGKDAPGNRGRVIRRASFLRFADSAEGQPRSGGAGAAERSRDRLTWPDGEDDSGALPGLRFLERDGQHDLPDDERYVPPDVPPQPKLDPVARGAWTALFGGPGYLFIATTLGWQVPGWAKLAAIVAFVSGFVILVSRLGDGPSRRDGPDQGAVV